MFDGSFSFGESIPHIWLKNLSTIIKLIIIAWLPRDVIESGSVFVIIGSPFGLVACVFVEFRDD